MCNSHERLYKSTRFNTIRYAMDCGESIWVGRVHGTVQLGIQNLNCVTKNGKKKRNKNKHWNIRTSKQIGVCRHNGVNSDGMLNEQVPRNISPKPVFFRVVSCASLAQFELNYSQELQSATFATSNFLFIASMCYVCFLPSFAAIMHGNERFLLS